MFNLGAGEVLAILLLALIVLGPTRLPDAAKQVGKLMGEMRKLSSGFQNEIKTAFDAETEADARKKGAAAAAGTHGAPVDASADALAEVTGPPAQPGKTPAVRADVEPTPPRPPRREPLRASAPKDTTPATTAKTTKPAKATAPKPKPKPKPATKSTS